VFRQPLSQDSVEQQTARKETCKLSLKAAVSREFHAHIDNAIIKAHDGKPDNCQQPHLRNKQKVI